MKGEMEGKKGFRMKKTLKEQKKINIRFPLPLRLNPFLDQGYAVSTGSKFKKFRACLIKKKSPGLVSRDHSQV